MPQTTDTSLLIGTSITDFDSAKLRAEEIKNETKEKFAAKLTVPFHFASGISANVAALLYLSDQIASVIGLSATAATLAAAGFDAAHITTDLIINYHTKKQFLEELDASGVSLGEEEKNACINSTHTFPVQFYPYILIMGTILFTGLNYGSILLGGYFGEAATSNPYFYLSNMGMNLTAGILFPAAGTLIKAQVPAALSWIIFVGNNIGLSLAPFQKYLIETCGSAAFTGIAAGVGATGAFMGRMTAPYVMRGLNAAKDKIASCFSWMKGNRRDYIDLDTSNPMSVQHSDSSREQSLNI
jgi:hypothetical protein